MEFTTSEKSIIKRIRIWLKDISCYSRYDFWFIYDENDEAINWEGGFELPMFIKFRNQYSIYKTQKGVKKNW